jgi:site-specific DNA-adenine methylase
VTLTNLSKAPFPWFGGKRKAAPLVWQLLGDVPHYVEPFCGTMAVLLERPHPCNRPYHSETVNDADGLLVNAWRSIQWYPEETAFHASWPVSEADKQARQIACLKWRSDATLDLLAGSAEWCDPKMAGWWLYGVCCQIGAFSGDGPWTADPITGRITKGERPGVFRSRPQLVDNGHGVNRPQLREPGVKRDMPHLSNNGQGVNHAGTREPGVLRDRPHLSNNGQGVNHAGTREPGVNRNRPHLSNNGQGVNRPQLREPGVGDDPEFHPVTMPELVRWFNWLAARLSHVRIVNGDWTRVVTSGAAHTIPVRQGDGPAGIFVDPPYDNAERSKGLYGHDDGSVAARVRHWATKAGDNPRNRIVIAGYDTEHTELEQHGWTVHEWFTDGYLTGGMGNTGGEHQQHRERLWASPHCQTVNTPQMSLWDDAS